MNLYRMLVERAVADRPIRVGLIGAGKFGAMFLSQARTTPGLHLVGIADLAPERARQNLARSGWEAERIVRGSSEALERGGTWLTDDAEALIASGASDVVIDATGDAGAGIGLALSAIAHGVHVVMVNVEADALAGPLLARRAREAGVVYSLAYGDQPALICEMVDWARACGFAVVAAGKGTKYLPGYHASTPETVWGHYGFTAEQVATGDYNAKMFNSFLDGSKSAIEMAAVANATGLAPAPGGLTFEPCGVADLADRLKPASAGGVLEHAGQVEVISSVERDGSLVAGDLRFGVFVIFVAPNDYTARCFGEYGMTTDASGRYSALYRPYHLIGLELAISVASVGLRGEPTGAATGFRGDVATTAKRDLGAGEVLDGEGGYTVWGRLMPAENALAAGTLPLGLANGLRLVAPVRAGEPVRWTDVEIDEADPAVRFRRELEAAFG